MSGASAALVRLDDWLTGRDYAGWDPYDGLGSRFGKLPGRRPRQAIVQTVKRLPPTGRRMLAVPQHRMTKTLALVASGLDLAPWLQEAGTRRSSLVAEIRSRRGRSGWGYEFDVQTRWGFYAADSPNAIVTAFALEAVHRDLDDFERRAIADWLTDEMWTGKFFRYVPGNDTCIHNANILSARALHRVAPGDDRIKIAIDHTTSRLPSSGLWPYGDSAGLEWVDNFHTAYVLDGLLDLVGDYPELGTTIDSVTAAYLSQCFAPDGTPRYFAGGGERVDVHNVATALHLIGRLVERDLAPRDRLGPVLDATLALEQRPGQYAPTRRAISFPRWNQGHVHKALAQVTS